MKLLEKKTKPSKNEIKLIKVPKFVAEQWKNSKDKEIVGLLDYNNNEICGIFIDKNNKINNLRCNKNNTLNTYILRKNKIILKNNSKNSNENELKKNKENINDNIESFICADIIKQCENIFSFYPLLNKDYSSILKERHYKANINKNRYTIIKNNKEESSDYFHLNNNPNKTLFKYYQNETKQNNKSNQININKYNLENKYKNNLKENKDINHDDNTKKYKHSKNAQSIDIDKTKIGMFKIFEKEGSNGVPFSTFTKAFNISPNNLKNILNEIAVKQRRPLDKKLVYFLK